MRRQTTIKKLKNILAKTLPRNNRGSSLVEIIVSMLILAIVVVPMLNMFVTSSRINVKSRQQQYATTVVENVMEEIKAGDYGIDKATKDLTVAEGISKYDLTIENILQGTGKFRATVTYDSTPYSAGGTMDLNTYQMPEITTFDSSNTVIVNVDFAAEEPMIADFFHQMHETAIEIENDASDTAAMELFWYDWAEWDAIIRRWDEEHPAGDATPKPEEPKLTDAKYQYTKLPTLTEAELAAQMHRETIITFTKVLDQCQVTASVKYTLPAEIDVGQTDGEQGVYETSFFASEWLNVDKMQYLYLLYCPFDASGTRENVVINAEEVHKDTLFDCRLLMAVQTEDTTYKLDFSVIMSERIAENSARLDVLSQTELINKWKTSADEVAYIAYPYNNTLVPLLAATDKVYLVTVKVYNQDGSDILAQAETTIYEKN